jgi:hypothetical protein
MTDTKVKLISKEGRDVKRPQKSGKGKLDSVKLGNIFC